MCEALRITFTQPLPRPRDEMHFIIMMSTPLTLKAHRACIMFSPFERYIRKYKYGFLSWFPLRELETIAAGISERRPDWRNMKPARFFSMLLSDKVEGCDQEMESDDECVPRRFHVTAPS